MSEHDQTSGAPSEPDESSGPRGLYDLLGRQGIRFEHVTHPPVYTCEEAERLVPSLPGADTKNLFLRDKKGRRHFLVTVGYDVSVDLKALAGTLGAAGLSFASSARLLDHLGVEPGSVSLLAAINDTRGGVEVFIDRSVWSADILKCHPLVNTATIAISREDLARVLTDSGHAPTIIDVPVRENTG